MNLSEMENLLSLPKHGLTMPMDSMEDLPLSLVVTILEKLDYLNPDWLLLGKGPMFRDVNPLKNKNIDPKNIHPEIWEVLNESANKVLQRDGQLKEKFRDFKVTNDEKNNID